MPFRDPNPLGIPRNILAAARAAGLSYPAWYVGRRERDVPRRKTLADLAAESEAKVAEMASETRSSDDRKEPT